MKTESHRIHAMPMFNFSPDHGEILNARICDLVSQIPTPSKSATPVPKCPGEEERIDPTSVTSCLPDRLRKGAQSAKGGNALLDRCELNEGSDLLPQIQKLVSGKNGDRCEVYRLSNSALHLLNTGSLYVKNTPKKDRIEHRLALLLPPSSVTRLKSDLPATDLKAISHLIGNFGDETTSATNSTAEDRLVIPIQIHQFFAHKFLTGSIIARLSISALLPSGVEMSTSLLNELADHAGRFANLVWVEAPSPSSVCETTPVIAKSGFSLAGLIARIMFGSNAKTQARHRTFVYTYALISEDEPEVTFENLTKAATMLARLFTSDYAMKDKEERYNVVSDFGNIASVISKEGAATLVYPKVNGKVVSFLKQFLAKAAEPTYLPLITLNLHQLSQSLSIGSSFTDQLDDMASNEEEMTRDKELSLLENLEKEQSRLARLKAEFRFHYVSSVTAQNEINSAARQAFNLNSIERELAADIANIANRVQSRAAIIELHQKTDFNKVYGWVPGFILAATSALFVLEVALIIQTFRKEGIDKFESASILAAVFLGLAALCWYLVGPKRR